MASLAIAACGGGGGGQECDPEDPTVTECQQDQDSDGANKSPNGSTGGNDNEDSSDGSTSPSKASEIPLEDLRDHIHNTPKNQRPPEFAEWERNMDTYGSTVGQTLQSGNYSSGKPFDVYYDGQYVFMQVAEYRGERQPWVDYAERAGDIYRAYLDRNDGEIPGYWRFSHGALKDFKDQGDDEARDYLVTLRDKPDYSDAFGPYGAKDSAFRGREIAYALQSHIMAEKAGEAPKDARDQFVEFALGHIDIWVSGDWTRSDADWQSWTPFMMGLNASALIDYYERTVELGDPDERVLPAIKKMADWLWKEMWVDGAHGSEYGAFTYRKYDGGTTEDPSRDLNMLIAPMYGWLYKETGEARFLNRGDEIFGGGVDLAWLGGGKQFNQNYRESFNYLRWRQEGLDRYGN